MPGTQSLQAADPGERDVCRKGEGQLVQVAAEIAPSAGEKVLGGQSVQDVALVADDHDPARQGTHTGRGVALVGYVVPGGHEYAAHEGALLPAGGPAEPVGQAYASHNATPTALGVVDHVPAGQGVQPVAEMAPGA